ncbi:MAG: hypothetical protein C0466_05485 [Candidatus Accumulibacter sp.]|nr:hypothetical protein [Accumulibacter sp.]
MDCEEMRRRIVFALDGELDAPAEAALDAHLEACPACRQFRQTHATARAALRRAASYHRAPFSLREAIAGALPGAAADDERRPVVSAPPPRHPAARTGRGGRLAFRLAPAERRRPRRRRLRGHRARRSVAAAPVGRRAPGRSGRRRACAGAAHRACARCRLLRPACRQAVVQRPAGLFAAGPRFRRARFSPRRRPPRLSGTARGRGAGLPPSTARDRRLRLARR